MSDKTSQSTEEEMLDQTFGGYDEEMTARTEDPQTAPAVEEKKKNNSNAIIIGGVGVAALGVIGYMFLGGSQPVQQAPAATPTPVAHVQTPAANPASTTPAVTPAAITPATTPEQGILAQTQNPLGATTPTDKPADGGSSATTGTTGTPDVTGTNVSVAQTTPATTPVTPAVNPAHVEPTTTTTVTTAPTTTPVSTTVAVTPATNSAAAVNNVAQQSIVNELKQLLDQQTKDIKSSVDVVGNRVTDLEKANKSIEERLARLEAGKPTVVASSTASTSSEKAPVKAKKVYHKSVTVKAKTQKAKVETPVTTSKDNVIVDKSSLTTVNTYPDIQIHSVYAGRVWTKNKDGSLSTYASGDTLPSGEVIKRIDEDKAQIVTNKRVIK